MITEFKIFENKISDNIGKSLDPDPSGKRWFYTIFKINADKKRGGEERIISIFKTINELGIDEYHFYNVDNESYLVLIKVTNEMKYFKFYMWSEMNSDIEDLIKAWSDEFDPNMLINQKKYNL